MQRLAKVSDDLRATGLTELLEQVIADVWDVNVARHEPSARGDTARSLGVTSAENIRELLLRDLTRPDSPWLARGVQASTPEGALTIRTCGLDLRIKKAPSARDRSPDWDAFDWHSASATHRAAAQQNAAAYMPTATASAQLALPGMPSAIGRPTGLTQVCLVWSGDGRTGLSAAWLGFPTLGRSPWLAVTPLWWHEQTESAAAKHGAGTHATSQPFSAQDVPELSLVLKTTARRVNG